MLGFILFVILFIFVVTVLSSVFDAICVVTYGEIKYRKHDSETRTKLLHKEYDNISENHKIVYHAW